MSLIIKNGTICTAENIYKADIFIKDETIQAIGNNLPMQVDSTIDATGLYIMPGGVDPHCHIQADPDGADPTVDDYETGLLSAAHGGTTTIIDIAFQKKGKTLRDGISHWEKKANNKAVIDYSFHAGIIDPTNEALNDMEEMIKIGIRSFKIFLSGSFMIEDDDFFKILQNARRLGGIVIIHAENGRVTDELARQAVESGNNETKNFADTRPPETEAEAVERVIILAEMVETPVYFFHISSSLSVEKIKEARARGNLVYGETCPHYLLLTSELLNESNGQGAKYICQPPLRTKKDQQVLWDALKNDVLQVVSSDHCAFNFKGQKDTSPNDFRKIPGGLPGVETRLPLVYSGVVNGHFNLNRFVQITATNPAKIFGLYPKKGAVEVGSDADLVLWDLDAEWEIKLNNLHMPVDYTPFEGVKVQSRPKRVILRGQTIINNGEYLGEVGTGLFVKQTGVLYE